MYCRFFSSVLAFSLCLTLGCGGSGPDKLITDQISLMNRCADAIEKNPSDPSLAGKFMPEIEALSAKVKALPPDIHAKLTSKYANEIRQAEMRFTKAASSAMKGIGTIPGLPTK